MPKRKAFSDVEYRVPGRKRPVAGSTRETSDFLALVHLGNPAATIAELREIITDRTRFILNPEAVAVLDAHIKAGHGNIVPKWDY